MWHGKDHHDPPLQGSAGSPEIHTDVSGGLEDDAKELLQGHAGPDRSGIEVLPGRCEKATPQGDRADERAPQETARGHRRRGPPSRQGNAGGSQVPPELQDGCGKPHGAHSGGAGGTLGQTSASILYRHQAKDRHAVQDAAAGPSPDGRLYQASSGLCRERA